MRVPYVFGVVLMMLHPDSYDWDFLQTDGTVGDSISTSSGPTKCHCNCAAESCCLQPPGKVGLGIDGAIQPIYNCVRSDKTIKRYMRIALSLLDDPGQVGWGWRPVGKFLS